MDNKIQRPSNNILSVFFFLFLFHPNLLNKSRMFGTNETQQLTVIFICGHVSMHVAHWIGAPDGDVVGGTGRRASTGTPPCGNYANRGFSP